MNNSGGIIGALCTLILLLIVVIYLAPALSDLQTINRGNEIVNTAKEGDIETATDEWADLTVDTVEGEVWSALWAPIIAFVVSGLIALYVFLRKHSS